MRQIIFKSKLFYIAIFGMLLALLLVYRSGQNPPPSTPLISPTVPPYKKAVAASGIVESLDENIRLAPAVSGLLRKLYVVTGQEIKEGQLLMELDDRQLYGQWLVLKAQYEKTTARYNKVKNLSDPQSISKEDRDNIRYDWQIAGAEVKRVEYLLDQLKVRAPVDGVILQSNTRIGEFVSTPINAGEKSYVSPLVMGRRGGLQVRAEVDEVSAILVKKGALAKAYIKGEGNNKAYDLEFVRIDPYIIPKQSLTGDDTERVDTRVLQVIFRIKNPENLYVGQQLDVYIKD